MYDNTQQELISGWEKSGCMGFKRSNDLSHHWLYSRVGVYSRVGSNTAHTIFVSWPIKIGTHFMYDNTQQELMSSWEKSGWVIQSKICNIEKFTVFSVFLVRGKSGKIKSIYFAESSGLSCWETEKEVLLPITQLGREDTHIILLSAWDRSCDSTANENLSKDM